MSEVKADSPETQSLLQKIRDGESAFDQLFAQHRGALRQAVDLRFDAKLRSRLDPSDVVQETQIEAFRRLEDYLDRQPMPFHLWLRKMAQERLIMARRQHLGAAMRSVNQELPLPEHSSVMLGRQLVAPGKSPSQQISQGELVRQVRQAVGQLGEQDREILLMRTYEDLSYQEIAYLLEIEPATARKRYGRALLRLNKLLTKSGFSESQL